MIFAVIGLSSASRHVTALSWGSGARFRSMDATDDGGVHRAGSCEAGADQLSDCEPSPLVVDTEAVRSRLGIEFRRWMSPSRWFSLKRSTAPKSDGFRAWLPALPGVGGPRDGEDAIDEVEVAGDGGFVVDGFGGFSMVVITLEGFLIRFEILFRRE